MQKTRRPGREASYQGPTGSPSNTYESAWRLAQAKDSSNRASEGSELELRPSSRSQGLGRCVNWILERSYEKGAKGNCSAI